MNMLPAGKIEQRALDAISSIITEHNNMTYMFNSMDKEMSRDGFILIFKDINGDQDKKNYDDKVPVQIKGHVDNNKRYLNRQRIQYAVELGDLEVYFKDRGVLYFQVFMSNDGSRREVFYASLFPTKIKYYLEKASGKGNKKNINITFTKLEKDPKQLYFVVKQFSNESKKQGFGQEQIVQNTIRVTDLHKVKSISMNVIGASNELEILKRLGSGDVSLYGTIEGCPISLPIEWLEDSKFFVQTEVNNSIFVGGEKYYEKYRVNASSHGEVLLMPSENIKIDYMKGTFNIKPVTKITTLKKDAEFLLALMEENSFLVGDKVFPYSNPKMPTELQDALTFYVELAETLEMIDFDDEKPFNKYSEKDIMNFGALVNVKQGHRNQFFMNGLNLYNWEIEDRYIPILVKVGEEGEDNKLYNAIYGKNFHTFVTAENGEQYRVPSYSNIKPEIFSNLYEYKYDELYQQVLESDINEFTADTLNLAALNMIHVFDKSGDERALEIAEKIMDSICEEVVQQKYYLINELQIKKRRGILTDDDYNELNSVESEEVAFLFGKNVVLGNYKEAEIWLNKMSEADRQNLEMMPIYKLYENIDMS